MADSSSTGIEAYSDSTALAETEHDIGFEQEDERDYNPNYSDGRQPGGRYFPIQAT